MTIYRIVAQARQVVVARLTPLPRISTETVNAGRMSIYRNEALIYEGDGCPPHISRPIVDEVTAGIAEFHFKVDIVAKAEVVA